MVTLSALASSANMFNVPSSMAHVPCLASCVLRPACQSVCQSVVLSGDGLLSRLKIRKEVGDLSDKVEVGNTRLLAGTLGERVDGEIG